MIKVVSVQRTCFACPAQWEGTTDSGEFVYARYRSGYMRVDVAPSEQVWSNAPRLNSFTVYEEDFGDSLDGYLDYSELKQHTIGVVEWPEFDSLTLI